jgi:hypothetical protein
VWLLDHFSNVIVGKFALFMLDFFEMLLNYFKELFCILHYSPWW